MFTNEEKWISHLIKELIETNRVCSIKAKVKILVNTAHKNHTYFENQSDTAITWLKDLKVEI